MTLSSIDMGFVRLLKVMYIFFRGGLGARIVSLEMLIDFLDFPQFDLDSVVLVLHFPN